MAPACEVNERDGVSRTLAVIPELMFKFSGGLNARVIAKVRVAASAFVAVAVI